MVLKNCNPSHGLFNFPSVLYIYIDSEKKANIEFCSKLLKSIGSILGPKTWLITSTTASTNLIQKVKKGTTSSIHSFRDGLPPVKESDVCIVMAPCVQSDYENSKQLATLCKAVVLVNGFAKVRQPILNKKNRP